MLSLNIHRYFKGKIPKRWWPKKWWLFHATNFQSVMYPCFTFCRILGMFPYKINGSTFEDSKPRYIISTLAVCIWCIIDIVVIYNMIISKINFENIIQDLESVCYYGTSGFIIVFTHILSGPRMRLLQTILEISSKLPSKSYTKLSRLIHFKDILGTIVLIMELYLYFSQIWIWTYLNILYNAFTIYCALMIFHLNMLYVNCVYILNACFENINENLMHMQRLVVNDTIPYVSTLICHMQRNQFFLTELKTLKKQHLLVSDAVKMLNIIFSLQLLATTVIIFSDITIELYFYAVSWQNGSLRISIDKHLFHETGFTIVYHIMLLMLLVYACETGKNQAHQIHTIIHDVLNNVIDEQLKDELQLFSLQTMHCKDIFSAKGLTMDAALFAAVMGSITTYMLIMIQFLIMSHSCDEKLHK